MGLTQSGVVRQMRHQQWSTQETQIDDQLQVRGYKPVTDNCVWRWWHRGVPWREGRRSSQVFRPHELSHNAVDWDDRNTSMSDGCGFKTKYLLKRLFLNP
eukprot:4124439-Amphidinium_carterae.1